MKLGIVHCIQYAGGTCTAGYFGGRPSPGRCARCEHGTTADESPVVEWTEVAESPHPMAARGPALWTELHTRALAYSGDEAAERAWLDRFATWVSCGDCREHWRKWYAEHPAALDSADAYFVWSVEAHNAVNARLSKPLLDVDAARPLYA